MNAKKERMELLDSCVLETLERCAELIAAAGITTMSDDAILDDLEDSYNRTLERYERVYDRSDAKELAHKHALISFVAARI